MSNEGPGRPPTLGILYPGEMGSTLGKLLSQNGFRVVTTLEGRSPRTRHLCQGSGFEVLASLRDVLAAADVVFSVVPPGAALAVAESCCRCRPLSSPCRFYVDLNSISPETVQQIEKLLSQAEMEFVDGAIHGLASQLKSRGIVYLSGKSAPRVADLFGQVLRVKVLGETAGSASALRMMISGMSKGVIALFLEMSLVAKRAGLLEDLLASYHDFYPGVMAVVDRLLPTYPQHASRRGEELREVEQTMASLGLRPCMVQATRHLIEEVGRLGLAGQQGPTDREPWSIREVVEAVSARNPLAASPAG